RHGPGVSIRPRSRRSPSTSIASVGARSSARVRGSPYRSRAARVARRRAALRGAESDLSAERQRNLSYGQMDRADRYAWNLLPVAVRALRPWTERATPGGADRSARAALLLLLHRDLAAGGLLHHRLADPRGGGAVPDECGGRARVVRLLVPADGLDRSVLRDRALDRRRPPRAHAARPRALDPRQGRPQARQALPLADGGVVDRRCLGALLRGR